MRQYLDLFQMLLLKRKQRYEKKRADMIIGLPHMLIMATVEEHIFQRSHFLILEQYRTYEGEAMFLLIQRVMRIV